MRAQCNSLELITGKYRKLHTFQADTKTSAREAGVVIRARARGSAVRAADREVMAHAAATRVESDVTHDKKQAIASRPRCAVHAEVDCRGRQEHRNRGTGMSALARHMRTTHGTAGAHTSTRQHVSAELGCVLGDGAKPALAGASRRREREPERIGLYSGCAVP